LGDKWNQDADELVKFSDGVRHWLKAGQGKAGQGKAAAKGKEVPPPISKLHVPIIYGVRFHPLDSEIDIYMQALPPPRNDVGQSIAAQQAAAQKYPPEPNSHPGSHLTMANERDIDSILNINRKLERVGICHNDLLKIHILSPPRNPGLGNPWPAEVLDEVPVIVEYMDHKANPCEGGLLRQKSSPSKRSKCTHDAGPGIGELRRTLSDGPTLSTELRLANYIINPTIDIFKVFYDMPLFCPPEFKYGDLWNRVWPIIPPDPRSIVGNCLVGEDNRIWLLDFGASSPLRGEINGPNVILGANIAVRIPPTFPLRCMERPGWPVRRRRWGGGGRPTKTRRPTKTKRKHRKKKRNNRRKTNKISKKRTNKRHKNRTRRNK